MIVATDIYLKLINALFSAIRKPSVEFYSSIKAIEYVTTLIFVDSFVYLLIQQIVFVSCQHPGALRPSGRAGGPSGGKKGPSPRVGKSAEGVVGGAVDAQVRLMLQKNHSGFWLQCGKDFTLLRDTT